MVIQHNESAAFANRFVQQNVNAFGKTVRKLSTGYRINTAADDAAGLTISENLRWQIRGLNQDSANIQAGVSLCQVADGALQEVHDMLKRMDELAVQAANDTNAESDRNALQKEIDEIAKEIDRIGNDTEFNTLELFKPRKSPTMKGKPLDVRVYHLDDGTAGGIIYNGIRYAYDKNGLSFDAKGNVKEGTYKITAKGLNNNNVDINLMFDGTSRVPVGRVYDMEYVQNQGLSIDGILHEWTELKDSQGNSLDPGNVKKGTYTFYHAGIEIGIDLEDGDDLDKAGKELVPSDGLFTYKLQSMGVSQSNPLVTTIQKSPSIQITSSNQNLIPIYTASNEGRYNMNADQSGMWLSYKDQNGATVNLDKVTWQQLGLTNFSDQGGINPGYSEVNIKDKDIEEDTYKTYTYKDNQSGISLEFTIDSEVSKKEMIESINAWVVNLKTTNQMNASIT